VCTANGDLNLLDGMESLVDKNLVRQEGDDEPRFSMLETIRDYAQEVLQERGDGDATRAAHAAYFLALAEQLRTPPDDTLQPTWEERLASNFANVRAALDWFLATGQADEELRLALAVSPYWQHFGPLSEGQHWLGKGLAHGHDVAPSRRAEALRWLGSFLETQGQYDRARHVDEDALVIFQELGDQIGSADTLFVLGWILNNQDKYEQGTALVEEGLGLARVAADPRCIADGLAYLATLFAVQGNLTVAREVFEQALEVERGLHNGRRLVFALNNIGVTAIFQGETVRARAVLDEALALSQREGEEYGNAHTLQCLGHLDVMQGDYVHAFERLRIGLLRWREMEARPWLLATLGTMTILAEARGEEWRAARLGGAVTALSRALRISLSKPEREHLEQALDRAKVALDEEIFARAWQEGQVMGLEEIVVYALSEVE
jgi:tetratricopeptide (TPR) repeat protein